MQSFLPDTWDLCRRNLAFLSCPLFPVKNTEDIELIASILRNYLASISFRVYCTYISAHLISYCVYFATLKNSLCNIVGHCYAFSQTPIHSSGNVGCNRDMLCCSRDSCGTRGYIKLRDNEVSYQFTVGHCDCSSQLKSLLRTNRGLGCTVNVADSSQ